MDLAFHFVVRQDAKFPYLDLKLTLVLTNTSPSTRQVRFRLFQKRRPETDINFLGVRISFNVLTLFAIDNPTHVLIPDVNTLF